jgi:intracellular multiplication protein IcmG
MTDTFGSDPHDQDGEAPLEKPETQDAVTEAPSDYEFSDEALAEEPLDEKSAHRSAFLPIAAAIGGVLLLGSVAWWQLGGLSSSSGPAPINKPAASILPLPAPTPSQAPAPAANPEPAAPKTDFVAQKEDTSGGPSLGASSSALPSSPEAPAPEAKSAENPLPSAPVIPAEAPAAATNSPAAEAVPPLAAPSPTAPVSAAVVPVAPAPVSVAPSQAINTPDPRIDMLASRVDSLQKALDQANQQLGQMTSALAASSNANAAPAPLPKDLQDRLDRIEQRIATLGAGPTPLAQASVVTPQAAPEATPVHKHSTAAKHKAPHVVAHKKGAPATQKTASAGKWVLRAASPGHAWVSQGLTSHNLKEIHVGDSISGIGKITAIAAQGDQWVVRGTKGTIQ